MGFDLGRLTDAVSLYGRVARILVAAGKGSTPREAGAAMLVWEGGQSGTIGGGTLEYQATGIARDALSGQTAWDRSLRHVPLGPALGQCCGGSVTLLTEVFSIAEITALKRIAQSFSAISRPLTCGKPAFGSASHRSGLARGHVVELFTKPHPQIWIYGAGHVGRALVRILPPLGFDIVWVDTAPERFPPEEQAQVTRFVSKNPALAVPHAPPDARHLVMTCSHALDLEICHAILSRVFLSAGLIGSASKWARFRKRLTMLGHTPARIARITCPIGMPELGKAPESVALGVACALLKETIVGNSDRMSRELAI